MSGLIVFLLQTFCYKETGLHHSRGKPLKLSRAYPQQLAARLHGVNPFSPLPLCKAFSVCLQAQPLPMLFGFTDEKHKPCDNKQAENGDPALLPWTDVRCLAHNESGGWDEREQGRWDSGSFLEWTGLAVVSLRGICMFKATLFSARGGN